MPKVGVSGLPVYVFFLPQDLLGLAMYACGGAAGLRMYVVPTLIFCWAYTWVEGRELARESRSEGRKECGWLCRWLTTLEGPHCIPISPSSGLPTYSCYAHSLFEDPLYDDAMDHLHDE